MASAARALRNLLRSKAHPEPLVARASTKLDTEYPIEEQTLPRYSPQRYYPVRLGESLKDRYLVISKLGYGSNSTVWLARDTQTWCWRTNPFVTLKILTNDPDERSTAKAELEVSQCIAKSKSKSEGSRYLRTMLDSFEVTGPHSTHTVLVYVPMRESISKFQRRMPDSRLPDYFLKALLELLLAGLDHLHSKCHIIHTDLKPDNILLRIEKQEVIDELLWDLVENRTLFEAADPSTKTYRPELHILEMMSLLGRPPMELLNRGEETALYFTAEGEPLLGGKKSRHSTLEISLPSFVGDEKPLFLAFARKMLRWLPEDRETAAELLQDAWLNS